MNFNIRKHILPLAAVLFMAGCHEAVEPESIGVNYGSFEQAHPELYAQYMQAVREYKAGAHKAVFVTMDVPEAGAATTHRTQHFMAIPDSVDFIVVNTPRELCRTLVDEMRQVREVKGTRVLFNIDLQTFENDWTQVLKEDPSLTEEDALAYLDGRVDEQIALADRWGYDGFIFTYPGLAVGSMQGEALEVYSARQDALFAPIRAWHEANPSRLIIFRGFTGALTEANIPLLEECAYMILSTSSVRTLDEMSFSALTAVRVTGVPADRLIVTAQTTRPGDDKKEFGYTGMADSFGNTIEAIEAWAGWTTLPSPAYTRAGLLIEDVRYDYYNPAKVWAKTREAIGIMNPSL